MQPDRRIPARTASANLIGENDIVLPDAVLRPVGENVADDPVLAGDLLPQADAADDFAGGSVEAGTLDSELKNRQRSHEIIALEFLHSLGRNLDDGVDGLIVGNYDLTLVAGGNGRDGLAEFTRTGAGSRAYEALAQILNQ